MNLQPIQLVPEVSSSARVIIRCHNRCGEYSRLWNDAAREGWAWDQEGEPYKAYYCKKCSDKLKQPTK